MGTKYMGFWCLDVMPGFGFTYGRRTAISNDKSFYSCPLLVNFTVTSLSIPQPITTYQEMSPAVEKFRIPKSDPDFVPTTAAVFCLQPCMLPSAPAHYRDLKDLTSR
jgi:hypothetical protein